MAFGPYPASWCFHKEILLQPEAMADLKSGPVFLRCDSENIGKPSSGDVSSSEPALPSLCLSTCSRGLHAESGSVEDLSYAWLVPSWDLSLNGQKGPPSHRPCCYGDRTQSWEHPSVLSLWNGAGTLSVLQGTGVGCRDAHAYSVTWGLDPLSCSLSLL